MNQLSPQVIIAVILVTAWQLLWKGLAMWRAAKNNQVYWFIALTFFMPFGDLGLIAILYLFFFAKHKLTIHEMTKWFSKSKHHTEK